jgi:hypothetical protein
MTFFTYEDKLKLKEEILKLNKNDWWNIYNNILEKNKEPITINKSGLLFDLINISNKSLILIKEYIDNINKNYK